jgi:hypothetical protein
MDKLPDPDPHDSWRAVQVAAVMRTIERYLELHPHASDSLTGVHHWWLSGLDEAVTDDVVRDALERLENAGRVSRRQLAPGVAVYARARGP